MGTGRRLHSWHGGREDRGQRRDAAARDTPWRSRQDAGEVGLGVEIRGAQSGGRLWTRFSSRLDDVG
jgi:hypothetical protein